MFHLCHHHVSLLAESLRTKTPHCAQFKLRAERGKSGSEKSMSFHTKYKQESVGPIIGMEKASGPGQDLGRLVL